MPFPTSLAAALMLVQPGAGAGPTEVIGTISASDPVDDNGRHYDDYLVDIRGGSNVAFTVMPRGNTVRFTVDFPGDGEPMIMSGFYSPEGSQSIGLATASGRGSVSTVRVRSSGTGDYVLRVEAIPAGGGGALGGIIGGVAGNARPRSGASEPPARFIICPGHPRCPR
jgi:hypothetical protein